MMVNSLFVGLSSLVALTVWLVYSRVDLRLRPSQRFTRTGCLPIRNANQYDPVFGLDLFLRLGRAASARRYLDFWDRHMFGRYGNTFDVRLMGQRLVFTNEPANIQSMLATQFHDFDVGQRRRDNSADLLGVGVFNADGADWAHARATVRPNFSRKQFSDLGLFEKHFQVWKDALPGTRDAVDLQEWAFRYTLDVGTEFLFGHTTGVLHPEASALGQRFAWAFSVGVDTIAQRIRLGKFARLHHNPDYQKACQMVHSYLDPIVNAALENVHGNDIEASSATEKRIPPESQERYTFLGALASEGVSPENIRNHLLNILLAARDTSACLMSAAFFELARQSKIQANLRAEINSHLQGRLPTYNDLKNMTYLGWVVKEVLRLYPPIPLNIRVANKDTSLPVGGGVDGMAPIFVPKGQEVVYQVFSTHRRRDLWGEDANEFKPERWESVRPHFQYLPFNAGPRICPGQQFALMETSYVIVRFLQEYAGFDSANGTDPWTENLTLTCSVGQGSWVRLTSKQ